MSIARTLADTVAAAGILNDGVITAAEVSGINIVTTSATAPVSPSAGDLWLSTEDGSLAIYLNDGDTLQWIVVSGPRGPAGADGTDGADGTSVSAGKTIALAMIFG